MKWMAGGGAPDLTARGRQIRTEVEPKLRRAYEPAVAEPLPSEWLKLAERLRGAAAQKRGA